MARKKDSNCTAINCMDKKEALKMLNKLRATARDIQRPIWELSVRKGFDALGYNSLHDYCSSEDYNLPWSYSSLNNARIAAEVTVDMAGPSAIGSYDNDPLLLLKKQTALVRKRVYKEAQKEFRKRVVPNSFLTKKFIAKALDSLGISATEVPESDTNDENQNKPAPTNKGAKATHDDQPQQQDNSPKSECQKAGKKQKYAPSNFESRFTHSLQEKSPNTKYMKRLADALVETAQPKSFLTFSIYLLEHHPDADQLEELIDSLRKQQEELG